MRIVKEKAAESLIFLSAAFTIGAIIVWLFYTLSIKHYFIEDLKLNMKEISETVESLTKIDKFEALHGFCNDKAFPIRLVSIYPLNIKNLADEEEASVISLAENGVGEYYGSYNTGDRRFLKLIRPISYQRSCQACHKYSGSKAAVVVNFDISYTETRSELLKKVAFISFIITLIMAGAISLLYGTAALKNLKVLSSKIERLQYIDDVTSFYTRTFLLKRLSEEFERSKRYKHNLALMIISMDNLAAGKVRAGDTLEMLKAAAEIIRSFCRDSDIYGRYGDTAFAIIIPHATRDGLSLMAQKIIKKISEQKLKANNKVSIGIAFMNFEDAYSPQILIYDAEAALNKAQEQGGNCYEIS